MRGVLLNVGRSIIPLKDLKDLILPDIKRMRYILVLAFNNFALHLVQKQTSLLKSFITSMHSGCDLRRGKNVTTALQ